MRKAALYVLIIALAACGLALVDSSAAQAAKPRISFGISHPVINAGQRPVIYYSVTKAKKGSKLYLQRKMGSRGVWGSVARLTKRSGRVVAPRVPIGAHLYRIAVYSKGKKNKTNVAASAVHGVRAYGKVRYRTFCEANIPGSYGCDSSATTTVGARAFNYQSTLSASYAPSWNEYPTAGNNSCRSMSLLFASTSAGSSTTTAMRVIQQTRDPRYAQAGAQQFGGLTVALDGRSFVLGTQYRGSSYQIGVSGSLSCYTANGAR